MSDDLERMRSGLVSFDPDTVKDALCLALLRTAGGLAETSKKRGRWDELDEITDFVELMSFLKRNFSFSELGFFSIDGDRVFVETGTRKVELHREAPGSRTPVLPPAAPAAKTPPSVPLTAKSERFRNLELDE